MNYIKNAKIVSYLLSFVGIIVMIGWILDLKVITGIFPNWPTMKFATALSFFLSSFILYFAASHLDKTSKHSETAKIILPAITLTIFLLMVSLFISSFLNLHTGIENLFVMESADGVKMTPDRPSIGTIVNFFLIAVAGILMMSHSQKLKKYLFWSGLIISIIGLLAIIGYIVDVPFFYYTSTHIDTGMAMHTAILFVLIGISFYFLGRIKELDANEMLDEAKDEINKESKERIRLKTVAVLSKNFFIRNWLLILIVVLVLALITPTGFHKIRKKYLNSKIKSLNLDLKKTLELIKALQKECFIAHKINTDTYHDRVLKYEERIAEVKHSLPILRARLARESFSYWGLLMKPFKRAGKAVVTVKSKVVSTKEAKGWNNRSNNNNNNNNNNNKVTKEKKKVVEKKVVKKRPAKRKVIKKKAVKRKAVKKKKRNKSKTDEITKSDIKKNLEKILNKK